MKSKTIQPLIEATDEVFAKCIAEIETVFNLEGPIKESDKRGSKISNRELINLQFAFENAPKIQNFLPRDFDLSVPRESAQNLNKLDSQIDELKRLIVVAENAKVMRRVVLKTSYSTLYAAAQKAKDEDASLKYIYVTLGEPYQKSPSTPPTPPPGKDTPV